MACFRVPPAMASRSTYAPGDLLRANEAAKAGEHLLLIDEINRADLARVLGEALVLFEVGAEARTIRLPHVVGRASGGSRAFSQPIRAGDPQHRGPYHRADGPRDPTEVRLRGGLARPECGRSGGGRLGARALFSDTLHTFAEFADEDVLRLVPGHAYFLDPLARRLGRRNVPIGSVHASASSCCHCSATMWRSDSAEVPPRQCPGWRTGSRRGCWSARESRQDCARPGP